jgi:glycosyltransferase involved in cell wall biosynthesis
VYSSIHLPLSVKFHHTPPLKHRSLLYALRRCYQRNDGLIAVSQGVAKEIMNLLHLDPAKVKIIYNPVVTPDIFSLANENTGHPWLQSKNDPVILAAGRLVPQKDFATLLQAFAELRKQRACKLIILGEGEERKNLEAQAEQLGLRDDVDLPGFVENPYAFMAQSNVFALSSAWEGFGVVLAEALALGVPVVSTNCPYGPSEILQHGKFGPLVQVGDARAFAQGMLSTMANPLEAKQLQSAAVPYTVRNCAHNYLSLLGL